MANPSPYHGGPPVTTPVPPLVSSPNPYAKRSLIYGIFTFVGTIVLDQGGYTAVGVISLYILYLSVRGLITAANLPSNAGRWSSIGGLVLGILSFALTLLFNSGIVSMVLGL